MRAFAGLLLVGLLCSVAGGGVVLDLVPGEVTPTGGSFVLRATPDTDTPEPFGAFAINMQWSDFVGVGSDDVYASYLKVHPNLLPEGMIVFPPAISPPMMVDHLTGEYTQLVWSDGGVTSFVGFSFGARDLPAEGLDLVRYDWEPLSPFVTGDSFVASVVAEGPQSYTPTMVGLNDLVMDSLTVGTVVSDEELLQAMQGRPELLESLCGCYLSERASPVVPEPVSWVLFALGGLFLMCRRI